MPNPRISLAEPLPPKEELAFHKEHCQINGVDFACFEGVYEGELLNGVDLAPKQLRGIDNKAHLIGHLQESQELVFSASSSLVVYSLHKKIYSELLAASGKVVMLKTYLEKISNREFIIWAETVKQTQMEGLNVTTNDYAGQRKSQLPSEGNGLLMGLLGLGGSDPKSKTVNFQTGRNSMNRVSAFSDMPTHRLRVYDYTRKEFIFDNEIRVSSKAQISDLFVFWSRDKAVGYCTSNHSDCEHKLHYCNVPNSVQKAVDCDPTFISVSNPSTVRQLVYNSQISQYVYYSGQALHNIKLVESTTTPLVQAQSPSPSSMFQSFICGDNVDRLNPLPIISTALQIERKLSFEQSIRHVAINQQFMAVLTPHHISFHSAFDAQSLIFTHPLQPHIAQKHPLKLFFNRSTLIVTTKKNPGLVTYRMRNKTLTLAHHTELELEHCKQIDKVYPTGLANEIVCVLEFYDRQRIVNSAINSRKHIDTDNYSRSIVVDIGTGFLSPSAKTEMTLLNLSRHKFKKVHTCPWLSSYLIEHEECIEFKGWKESFENKRCMAMHPNGIFLVICFLDVFKIFIITAEGLTNTFRGENIKDIQSCAISPYGDHIAVASSTAIYLYDFYSCRKVRTINLSFGNPVESLEYSGLNLVCTLRNKKVYVFDSIKQYKQKVAFNPKVSIQREIPRQSQQLRVSTLINYSISEAVTGSVNCTYYDHVLNLIIYSCRNLVCFHNCATNTPLFSAQLAPVSCIHYCANLTTLFMGTQDGEVITFNWPNKPTNLSTHFRRVKLHAGKIIDLKVTSDLKELITIADDQSVSVNTVTFVKNLKRMQGTEMIEFMPHQLKLCYDFLTRKGVCQYTHGKYNQKADLLRDYQEEVLNRNFILPEESLKQKQFMVKSLQQEAKDLEVADRADLIKLMARTEAAKDKINNIRDLYDHFEDDREQEKKKIKLTLLQGYMKAYETAEASLAELNRSKVVFMDQKMALQSRNLSEMTEQKQNLHSKYQHQMSEFKVQCKNHKKNHPDELAEIDVQKEEFISQNIESLSHLYEALSRSSGVLTTKNNSLQKQNQDLKKKIEERKFLLYRLQSSTNELREEQQVFQATKRYNQRMLEQEDRTNLAQIERQYVKQTKHLIDKDKEVTLKIHDHNKEQESIIELQKYLQQYERYIEQTVDKQLVEKKHGREESNRLDNIKQAYRNLSTLMISRKRERIVRKTALDNYIYQLEEAITEAIADNPKGRIYGMLKKRGLLEQQNAPVPSIKIRNSCSKERKLTTQTTQSKAETDMQTQKDLLDLVKEEPRVHQLKRKTTNNKMRNSYRKLKTEALEDNRTSYLKNTQMSQLLGLSARDTFKRKNRQILHLLKSEESNYQRMHTQQALYEHTMKRMTLESQDLIENYNSLTMEKKRVIDSLKRQDLRNPPPKPVKERKHSENKPTPFMQYVRSKEKSMGRGKSFLASKMLEI